MKIQHLQTYVSFLREGRELAQKDSENFDALVQAFERIGAMEKGSVGNGLGAYEKELLAIAGRSPLADGRPAHFHTTAENLFSLVRLQRNDAIHQGVIARNLVRHSIEFALVLEHALTNMENIKTAADLMVRDVCFAQLDHPMSYIRQRMLVNSFSFLPVFMADGSVKMLSDVALAKWLRRMDWKTQTSVLIQTLRVVMEQPATALEMAEASLLPCDARLPDLVKNLNSTPVLLHEPTDCSKIVGLISAFDLL
jgi:predicted transcriptional regulator